MGPGACGLPSGWVLTVGSGGISLDKGTTTAITWYHVYAYNNAGTTAIEMVTTVPSQYAYPGHHKTGDTSRRYLGSVRSNASTDFYRQTLIDGKCFYMGDWASQRVLAGGTATDFVAVSLAGVAPVTMTDIKFGAYNAGGSGIAGVYPRNENATGNAAIRPNNMTILEMPVLAYPNCYYKFTSTPGGAQLFLDTGGYNYAR